MALASVLFRASSCHGMPQDTGPMTSKVGNCLIVPACRDSAYGTRPRHTLFVALLITRAATPTSSRGNKGPLGP